MCKNIKKSEFFLSYCDICNDDVFFKKIYINFGVKIREGMVSANVPMLSCHNCGNMQTDIDDDPMVPLYNKYRKEHGFLSPEEIKSIRENSKLSLKDFAESIGSNKDTLMRIEGGALQEKEIDDAIKNIYCDSETSIS